MLAAGCVARGDDVSPGDSGTGGPDATVQCPIGTAPDAGTTCVESGPPPADGPFACGSQTCAPSQYCVMPCCEGPIVCTPPLDGGACPPGWARDTRLGCTEPGDGGPGCIQECFVTPPQPYCLDDLRQVDASGGAGFGCPLYGRTLTCICGA
jgi:hypothetical protein